MAETAKIFREVTQRICGNLEIEDALADTFQYIRKYIPADTIGLGFSDVTDGYIHIVAKYARDGANYIWDDDSSQITLSSKQKEYLLTDFPSDALTMVVNKPQKISQSHCSKFFRS